MSRSLPLCILVIVCVICISATGLIVTGRSGAGLEGLLATATPTYRGSGRLAANRPSVSPFPASPAGTWSDQPVQDDVLDTLQARHLFGFDAGVLSGWRMADMDDLMTWLQRGIWFEGDWTSEGLRTALQGLRMTLQALDDNRDELTALLGTAGQGALVYQVCAGCYDTGSHYSHPELREVTFDSNPDLISFLHETGHVADYHLARDLGLNITWWSEVGLVGLGWQRQVHQSGEAGAYYLDGDQDAPHSEYSPREDFADTFAAWVLEKNYQPLPDGWRAPSYRRVLLLTTLPGVMLE